MIVQNLVDFELRLCCLLNRLTRWQSVRLFFHIISRLGDGMVWYLLMLLLPFMAGSDALHVSLRMAIASLLGLLIYKLIKSLTERPRPFTRNESISLGSAPLDRYSFPSGHTLHAVSFSIISIHYYPELAWILVPFSAMIAASRVILGLHYPTDVIAGAALGAILATCAITVY